MTNKNLKAAEPIDVEANVLGGAIAEHGEKATAMALSRIERSGLSLYRPPEEILKDAGRVAKALMGVINAKPEKHRVIMNGEQYIQFDDWQLVGNFYGTSVKIADDRLVQIDMGNGQIVTGYEATAEVIHIKTGAVLSAAKGMCLNDEPKWSDRNKYAWCYVCKDGTYSVEDPGYENITWKPNPAKPGKNLPVKEKRQIGTEKVPLFQLRSMAQTRSAAKALRLVFSHVVILAGYAGTPLEEMTGEPDAPGEEHEPPSFPSEGRKTAAKKKADPPTKATATPPPVQPPPAAQATPVAPPAAPRSTSTPPKVTPAQVRRFWALAQQFEWLEGEIRDLLVKEANGVTTTSDLLQGRNHYDRICSILETGPRTAGYRK